MPAERSQRVQGNALSQRSTDLHLGLNLGNDRTAALVSQGELLVAIEEERLDRCKHSPGLSRVEGGVELSLPWRSIRYCLEAIGAELSDLCSVTANSPAGAGPAHPARGVGEGDAGLGRPRAARGPEPG